MAELYEPFVTEKGRLGYNCVTEIQLLTFPPLPVLLAEQDKLPARLAQSDRATIAGPGQFAVESWRHFDVRCYESGPCLCGL